MLDFLAGGIRLLIRDLLSALDAALMPGTPAWKLLPPLALGMAASWMVYVPVHELLHVAGCVVTGGTVTELRLSPIYGAALLSKIFPFIVPSSEYAGRLAGFSTGGSDLRYLATDFAPYLLTILVGVPLLRSRFLAPARGEARGGRRRAWLFGPAVVLAAAPVISLTGDYFEMGSILLTRGYSMVGVKGLEVLRSDDLFRLLGELSGGQISLSAGRGVNWIVVGSVITSSLILALCLASTTYRLGVAFEGLIDRMGRRRAAPSAPPSPAR
jgi:hypothetical protein